MGSYQSITILGNATRDAEVRQVGQSSVAKIGIAVSEKFRKQDGTTGENTEFFEVEIWDKPALNQYLTKGQSLLVIGQIKTEKWTDQSGQNREAKKVRASIVQLCGGPRQQAQPSAPAPQAPGYAPAPGYQAPTQPQYQQPAPAPAPQYQAPAQPPQYAPPTPPASPQYAPPAPPAAPAYAPNTGQPYPQQPAYVPQAEGPDLPF